MREKTTSESQKGSSKVNFPSRQWFSKVETGTGACFERIYPLQHSGVGRTYIPDRNYHSTANKSYQSLWIPGEAAAAMRYGAVAKTRNQTVPFPRVLARANVMPTSTTHHASSRCCCQHGHHACLASMPKLHSKLLRPLRRFDAEIVIIYKLSSRKVTTQNDLY